MDKSCKRRAYCLYHSFVIVHTEHGQGQAFLTQELLACLAEVSVTNKLYGNFQNSRKSWGELSMCKQCVPGSFYPPMHKSLGTRLQSGKLVVNRNSSC